MTSKKQQIVEVTAAMYPGLDTLTTSDFPRPLSQKEQGIETLRREQSLLMEGYEKKVALALSLMNKMHRLGATHFQETVKHHVALVAQAAGTPQEHYVRTYVEQDILQLVKHTTGTIEVGAHVIAQVVSSSLIPPDERLPEPEKPGFWLRLLGAY